MKRGDYDHNHSLLSGMYGTIIIVILVAMVCMGGLAVGLSILGQL